MKARNGIVEIQALHTPTPDSKLEACAAEDAGHVTPGARGDHVGKIQLALNQLDANDLKIDGIYGPRTAAAVKNYKNAPARRILGPSQKTADDIVGKRTIASLDDEMARFENRPVPAGEARFARLNPADRADGFAPARRGKAAPPVTLGVNSVRAGANAATFETASQLTVVNVNSLVRLVRTLGTAAMFVSSDDATVTEVVDSSGTPGAGPAEVGAGGALFAVVRIRGGQKEGRAVLTARDGNGQQLAQMTVVNVAPVEKPVAFTYLRDAQGGQSGVASDRDPGDEVGLLAEVNKIYTRQTGITFKSGGARTQHIPEFGAATDVNLELGKLRAGDWTKIYPKHRVRTADFNVVFVRNIRVPGLKFPGGVSEIVVSAAGRRDTVIDNRTFNSLVQSDGVNLAHELGHALGESHNGDPESLMSSDIKVGLNISLDLATRMRANLKTFTQK